MTKIRLSTASPATQTTTKETLAQLRTIAVRAAAHKADLLLLPEAYIGGYPRGSDFGCRVGGRTPEGREEYLHYFRAAVDLGDTVGETGAGAGLDWVARRLPPPALVDDRVDVNGDGVVLRGDGTREELERIARDTGVFIITGLIEKAGGSLYCAVVYVCPKLGILGKRRKVMPTGSERLIWAQGSPKTLKAVSTTIHGVRINLAAAICWENYMPLLRQTLYAQNVNLYLAPTADNRDAWLSLMRTVAIEGRCFVVSSNMCARGSSSSGTTGVATSSHVASGSRHQRRNSCITEDGFEIALPMTTTTSPKKRVNSTGRRRSILDEDGHEIVLPLTPAAATAATAPAPPVFEEASTVTTTPHHPATVAANEFVSRGGSSIVSPMGDVLAGPQWEDDEGIIYADVDFDDCIRGRLDLDAAGSYSRNDSFKFSVGGLDLDPLPY